MASVYDIDYIFEHLNKEIIYSWFISIDRDDIEPCASLFVMWIGIEITDIVAINCHFDSYHFDSYHDKHASNEIFLLPIQLLNIFLHEFVE